MTTTSKTTTPAISMRELVGTATGDYVSIIGNMILRLTKEEIMESLKTESPETMSKMDLKGYSRTLVKANLELDVEDFVEKFKGDVASDELTALLVTTYAYEASLKYSKI